MFAASVNGSVNARSVIVLTCTATALLTAWIIAAAPVVGAHEGRVRIVMGQVRPMGEGTVRSWVRVDARDRPTAIGVTFTEAALQHLPPATQAGAAEARVAEQYRLTLPPELPLRPFTHVVVNWTPADALGRAQFGFRFCGDSMPQTTTDPAAPQFAPGIAVGSSGGRLSFVEPVMTSSHLAAHPDEAIAVDLPPTTGAKGYVPAQCRVKYDPATREYSVSLEGLTTR